MKKIWASEIIEMALEDLEMLSSGELSPEGARARSSAYKSVAKLMDIAIAYAKDTGRIVPGSDTIPDVGLNRPEVQRVRRATKSAA